MMKPDSPVFSRKNRALYCFADSLPLCRSLLDGGARIIQLRAKGLNDSAFRELAEEMQMTIRRFPEPATLIINDRVDIALDIHADGLHLGQDDSDYRSVIKAAPPGMIIGVSVRNTVEALDAGECRGGICGSRRGFPHGYKIRCSADWAGRTQTYCRCNPDTCRCYWRHRAC